MKKTDNIKNEFNDFINAKEVNPPEHLDRSILNFVKDDLDPAHKMVFAKLLAIQAFIGFLTLLFCPQFNLSLTNNYELFHYFHHNFGIYICSAICGSIFIGSGTIFASYLLTPYEIKKIKDSEFLYYFALSLIAVSLFIFLGTNVYLGIVISWMLGAIIGGVLLFEVNRSIRLKLTLTKSTL